MKAEYYTKLFKKLKFDYVQPSEHTKSFANESEIMGRFSANQK